MDNSNFSRDWYSKEDAEIEARDRNQKVDELVSMYAQYEFVNIHVHVDEWVYCQVTASCSKQTNIKEKQQYLVVQIAWDMCIYVWLHNESGIGTCVWATKKPPFNSFETGGQSNEGGMAILLEIHELEEIFKKMNTGEFLEGHNVPR